jgi:hypothetical protein
MFVSKVPLAVLSNELSIRALGRFFAHSTERETKNMNGAGKSVAAHVSSLAHIIFVFSQPKRFFAAFHLNAMEPDTKPHDADVLVPPNFLVL